MRAISKARLQAILSAKLRLKEPKFVLKKLGTHVYGSIISDSFKGKPDLERQGMIRDALEDELGIETARKVGTLLAYTWDEWEVPLEADLMRRNVRRTMKRAG